MKQVKSNEEAINEIYRNVNTAIDSINFIKDEILDEQLKQEILSERTKYQNFLTKLTEHMQNNGYERVEVNAFKKTMMKAGVKMNTAFDNSKTHVAELMLKGSVAGICELVRILNSPKYVTDEKIIDFCSELKNLEEEFETRLKTFL